MNTAVRFRATASGAPSAWRISALVDRQERITRTIAAMTLRLARKALRAKHGKYALPDTMGTLERARLIVSEPDANPILLPVSKLFCRAIDQ